MSSLLGLLLATVVGFGGPAGFLNLPVTDPATARWQATFDSLPPCAEEDSRDCAWDAGTEGNGMGQSFYDLDGVAHYADGSTQDNS